MQEIQADVINRYGVALRNVRVIMAGAVPYQKPIYSATTLTLVLLRGLQQPPNSFHPGAQNRTAKG